MDSWRSGIVWLRWLKIKHVYFSIFSSFESLLEFLLNFIRLGDSCLEPAWKRWPKLSSLLCSCFMPCYLFGDSLTFSWCWWYYYLSYWRSSLLVKLQTASLWRLLARKQSFWLSSRLLLQKSFVKSWAWQRMGFPFSSTDGNGSHLSSLFWTRLIAWRCSFAFKCAINYRERMADRTAGLQFW